MEHRSPKSQAPHPSGRERRWALVLRGILVVTLAVGPLLLPMPQAQAQPTIRFHDCETEPSPSPTPTPTPSPTPTPEPEEPEGPDEPEDPDPVDDGEDGEGDDGDGDDPEACMPREGQGIAGEHTLRFTVETETTRPIARVRLFVHSDEEEVPHPNGGEPVRVWEFPATGEESTTEETFTPTLDTGELTPHNAPYTLRVDVVTHGPDPETGDRGRPNVKVDNPPRNPGPPMVSEIADDISVEWRESPEVDVTAYTVYRARTTSRDDEPDPDAFAEVHTGPCDEPEAGMCSFLDSPQEAGTYWYKTRTTRRSVVTPEEGISSELSEASGPGVVTEPTPAPTTRPRTPTAPRDRELSAPSRPRLQPQREVPSRQRSAGQDSEFQRELPYDLEEQPEGDGEMTYRRPRVVEEAAEPDPGRRGAIAGAIGAFLVAAGLAVGRMPW